MSASDIMFFTGVSKTVFLSLAEAVCKMTAANSRLPTDQLLIKVMRLRLGLLYGDLARRFETSVTRIGDIVRNMLRILKKIP
uniref:Transposase Helix-turn-helix domain-containing protein n=1 Tax=Ixodes ricinus TaxID=34613 RepID=V5H380_IXORI